MTTRAGTTDQMDQGKTIRQRSALDGAYAALLGQQSTQTFLAFTFEEAVDAQIQHIEGKGSTPRHPNQLDRVQYIRDQLITAVAQVKKIDPSKFRLQDAQHDVNTEPG